MNPIPSLSPRPIPLPYAPGSSALDPERLLKHVRLSDAQKVAEVARQFEVLFVKQILEQARKTDHQSSYALGQSVAPFHQDLINTTIAHSVARSGDLGLATTLQAQLQRQLRTVGPSSPESVPPSPLP